MDATILIIEDDSLIHDALTFSFKNEGYNIISAYDGQEGLELCMTKKPDIVLLDINLPKMDGMDVCKNIRKESNIPIIMLTAREDEVDKVLGLELGADDYMTKPYSMRELSARVKALLRRASMSPDTKPDDFDSNIIRSGNIVIDTKKYELHKNGQKIDLPLRTFELLSFLASSPEQIFSRETLLRKVWGYEHIGKNEIRTVDVTISRLREKLEDKPSAPRYIITKRNLGYYFNKIDPIEEDAD